ncbi:MAG: diacylglycerol kinase family protein [Bacillota bacterium]|nr:diacylglycerol kinase family protein [Bacillota bacterium]
MREVQRSLKNACIGLVYCFRTQRNMTIHGLAGIAALAAGLSLRVGLNGMLFLVTAVVLVLVAETFNTSVEKTIDLYTKKRSHLAQTSKDVAAGAVLLTAVYAVIVGVVVLGPPLWSIIRGIL